MADAALAYALTRYDSHAAALILEDAIPLLLRDLNTGGNHVVEALAMLDPIRAARVVEELANDHDRERLATRLRSDGDALWRLMHGDLDVWWPDDED
jgi:hypothetical protein